MPAKSDEQKQLMAWAYACKNGKTTNCPEKVKNLADKMTNAQLKDFFESEEHLMNEFEAAGGTSLASLNSVPGQGSVTPPTSVMVNGGSGSGIEIVGSGDVFNSLGIKKKKRKRKKNHKSDDINDIIRQQTEDEKDRQKGSFNEHLYSFEKFLEKL